MKTLLESQQAEARAEVLRLKRSLAYAREDRHEFWVKYYQLRIADWQRVFRAL